MRRVAVAPSRAAFLLLLAVFPVQTLCFGTDGTQDWKNLSPLKPGHQLTVVTADAKYLNGQFISVAEEGLTVKREDKEVFIPRGQVLRVSSRKDSKRLRNGLICAGIGAAAGYLIGVVSRGTKDDYQTVRGFGALVGIGAGFGVGAALPAHPTIYRAPKRPDPKK